MNDLDAIIERIAERVAERLKPAPKPKPTRPAAAPRREPTELERVQRHFAFLREYPEAGFRPRPVDQRMVLSDFWGFYDTR